MPKKETIKKITKYIEIKVFLKNASIIEEKKRKFIWGGGGDRENDEWERPNTGGFNGVKGVKGYVSGAYPRILVGGGGVDFFSKAGGLGTLRSPVGPGQRPGGPRERTPGSSWILVFNE